MINPEKLKAVIVDYKRDFALEHWENERYKWEAVEHFQKHWDIKDHDFAETFTKATEKTYNLLASRNNFPRAMIRDFATADPEATRAMFMNLFDETKGFAERMEKLTTGAEALRAECDDGTWKQHYQNPNSISTYLWLR